MKILMTGATGFLASHLLPLLAARGHEVVSVGRALDRVSGLLDRVDAVIHLAAQTEVGRAVKNPMETLEANIAGTWRVLEACRLAGVKRVVTASTDKAYGRTVAPYDESTPMTPDRPYETSKACADLIARMYGSTYGMSVAVTRCVNLYGPGHLNFSTLIPGTIKRILCGERPILRNGGRMIRDFLYVDDAAEAYAMLLESDYTGPMCFGTGYGHSVREIVNRLLTLMKSDLKPVEETDRHGELDAQWSLFSRASQKLGWKPRTAFDEGLKKTVEWYRAFFAERPK